MPIRTPRVCASSWRWWWGVVLLLGLAWLAPSPVLLGQPVGVSIQPPGDWVRQAEWRGVGVAPTNNQAEGVRFLLFERQFHPQLKEEFGRAVQLMRNEAGVQDAGSLSVSYDPDYQQLVLHKVQIHRGGQSLDRLDGSKIKSIQPESELDDHMFTGRKSAVVFVEDLRVGDVLEYSYTRRGANPALGDHFSEHLGFQGGVPVDRQHYRIVWPFDRPLHLRQHRTEFEPLRSPFGKGMDFDWSFTNVVALAHEDGTPAGYEPYPYCEVSDFGAWADVVEWALPLYAEPGSSLPVNLQKLIAQWDREVPSIEERARLALQLVQDDIRYTGLELGPDSYRPTPSAETFERRFGDCKGKALLLCAVLKALKVEAWPVLVNTRLREAIARQLPSPFNFDHVIVKLELPGQSIWVDPTLSHQGGSLSNRHLAALGLGLVVREGVTALEAIPPVSEKTGLRVVSTFTITRYDAPVLYTVTSIYRGQSADHIRLQLARLDPAELSRSCLNYAARFYPGITNAKPPQVSDDRASNVVTLVEGYQIKDLWSLDDSSNRWTAAFYAESLYGALPEPTTRLRANPLSIPFPLRREQEVVVQLPDTSWQIPERKVVIEHEAFAYRYHRKLAGSTLRFRHEVETKGPEIPADQVAAYLKKRSEAEELLGDTLLRPSGTGSTPASINWLMVVIVAFGCMMGLAVGAGLWKWTSRPADSPPLLPAQPDLQGLGGWLILVGLGLCAAPFVRLSAFVKHWEGYFSMDTWQLVAVHGAAQYHPLYGPLLVFEALSNSVLFGFNLVLIGMFFAKRRIFPKAYIALMLSGVAFLVLDAVIGSAIPSVASSGDRSSSVELVRAIGAGALWSAYMLSSKRVRSTFVR